MWNTQPVRLVGKVRSVSSMPTVYEVSASSHGGESAEREEREEGKGGKVDVRKGGEERGWGWRPGLPRRGPVA